MITERLTDISAINPEQVAGILATGKGVTIQFSKPCYDAGILAETDSLCREYGNRIEVRFYGHYSATFDARCLDQIPNVQWLSVDCLTQISAIERLFDLTRLCSLSIGVFEMDLPDLLARVRGSELRELFLCETRKSNIDLAPLARFPNLTRLHVASHHNGFSVLKDLGSLSELSLRSLSKKQSLEILAGIRGLQKLQLILGGRTNFDEFSHERLQELAVVRVLGFSVMGNLGRFPSLQSLRIEDQIKLEAIDLGEASPTLIRLLLLNCKKLRQIGRLDHLVALEDLRISRTNLDFEAFLSSPLPPSLRTVAFWTGSAKTNAVYRAKLDELGYAEFTRKANPA